MKKSEMVKIIKKTIDNSQFFNKNRTDILAKEIFMAIKDAGMNPPVRNFFSKQYQSIVNIICRWEKE